MSLFNISGLYGGAAALLFFTWAGTAAAGSEHSSCNHQNKKESRAAWVKSTFDYKLPNATLVRADGKKVRFPQEIDDGKPVILNFIFTSCTAVCPVMTQTFSEVQTRLGTERDKVRMVSISIDPEQDTPERLKEYAQQFDVGNQWDFYTGSAGESISVQKAFNAYRGDKMNHKPLTFIRSAPGQPWVRMEGFASPDEIVGEYRMLVRAK